MDQYLCSRTCCNISREFASYARRGFGLALRDVSAGKSDEALPPAQYQLIVLRTPACFFC
jgi:hypothetical protein